MSSVCLYVSIQTAKTRPGADCGSDHELPIAKFRLKLRKVGKTTRPFTYDLNQIPYNYTVEVTNRFKGLDFHVSFSVTVFSGYMPSNGIVGSYGSFGEENGTPLQYSCLENPMEGGAW